jgi:hypothetical protein
MPPCKPKATTSTSPWRRTPKLSLDKISSPSTSPYRQDHLRKKNRRELQRTKDMVLFFLYGHRRNPATHPPASPSTHTNPQ